MPSWFNTVGTGQLVRKGRAGHLLLLTWSMMGMIIMFGMTCNLRAIFMRVDYEKPLDTAKSIFESGKSVNIHSGGFYRNYLEKSDNPWHGRLAALAIFYTG